MTIDSVMYHAQGWAEYELSIPLGFDMLNSNFDTMTPDPPPLSTKTKNIKAPVRHGLPADKLFLTALSGWAVVFAVTCEIQILYFVR